MQNPESLGITDAAGVTHTGGSQEWYADAWHKKAGCGPVTASGMIWHMARPEPSGEPCEAARFLTLMDEMYTFITPTLRGVNTSAIFTEGIKSYGAKHGLNITPHTLEIPALLCKRPDIACVCGFIRTALESGSAVAFLNLSNGTLKNLDNWHWVTVIALDDETHEADICDQGKVLTVDLGEWLKTTVLGGAFVYIEIQKNNGDGVR